MKKDEAKWACVDWINQEISFNVLEDFEGNPIEGGKMKYEVITSDSLSDFEFAVNEKLSDGWKLHDGITTNTILDNYKDYQTIFHQAMAKESN